MKNKATKQYIILFLTNFGSIGLAFISNIIITSFLTESNYGTYKYVINLITMIVSLTNFGIYYSTARLLTNSNKHREKDLYGATISIMTFISIVVGSILFFTMMMIDKYIYIINREIFYAFPLIFTVMFQRSFMYMLKGSNKILDMCIQTVMPQIILLMIYSYLKVIGITDISFEHSLIAYTISFLMTHMITIFRLKIKPIKGIKKELKNILYEQKKNGFEIYKGSLLSVFTADILNVIIGTVSLKADYGAYSLALSFSGPILQIPSIMGTISFKKNANLDKLSKKEIFTTFIISFISYIILNIGIYIIIPLVYKGQYTMVPLYTLFLSGGYILHGFGDYFNSFLNSHGMGTYIKKGAIISGVIQVIFAAILVPTYSIWGLVISRILSSLGYFSCMLYSYWITTRLKSKEILYG